jgi:hypothetical protein
MKAQKFIQFASEDQRYNNHDSRTQRGDAGRERGAREGGMEAKALWATDGAARGSGPSGQSTDAARTVARTGPPQAVAARAGRADGGRAD